MTSIKEAIEEILLKIPDVAIQPAGYLGTPEQEATFEKIRISSKVEKLESIFQQELDKAVRRTCLEVIGKDIPLDQPFDSDMGNIELMGNRIFRKGVNWSKAKQRQELNQLIKGEE